jgi:hypothetical protein
LDGTWLGRDIVPPPLGVKGELGGNSDEAGSVNDELKGSENDGEEFPVVSLSRLMEAFGSLPVFWASIPCVVIGEDWPAWLPILPSLGARVAAAIGQTGYVEEEEEGFASAECWKLGKKVQGTFYLKCLKTHCSLSLAFRSLCKNWHWY